MSDKRPRWYDPTRALVTFRGGPRDREWMYADRWELQQALAGLDGAPADDRSRGYEATREQAQHPKDERVEGRVWVWALDSPTSHVIN